MTQRFTEDIEGDDLTRLAFNKKPSFQLAHSEGAKREECTMHTKSQCNKTLNGSESRANMGSKFTQHGQDRADDTELHRGHRGVGLDSTCL
jgi:hypothetical protein